MYDIKNVFAIEQVFKYVIIFIHIEIALRNLHSNILYLLFKNVSLSIIIDNRIIRSIFRAFDPSNNNKTAYLR